MSQRHNGPREERDCARCGRRCMHAARMGSRTAEWECANCGATSVEFVTAEEIRARRPAPAPSVVAPRSARAPKRRPRQTQEERRAFAQAAALDREFRRAAGAE